MERRRVARPQRVLLVDDSAELRELWRLWLTCWGFAVEEARNGAEAVEKARARPPDLILMDLAMPVLDGRAAMQLLASDPATARIPVLAMSAQTTALPEEGAGTDAFLPKPAELDRLLEHIRAAFRHGWRDAAGR
jgi:CheY-like chemotaxis protein